MAVILNKNSFWLHSQLTAFASKTTLARIGYLPPDGQQVTLKGADNVKINATYFTKLAYTDTNTHHISKDKVHTLAACIFHVINNREASKWK